MMRSRSRLASKGVLVAIALGLGATAGSGCDRADPEPSASTSSTAVATTAAVPATSDPTAAAAAWRARHARDDAGNLIPKSTPPPVDSSLLPPKPGREPDWDLDANDAARDYVRRYALGTKRYGATLKCADIRPSVRAGDKVTVEVRSAAGCPDAGTVRDVFVVDVAGDRLGVDDPAKRDPLARWPDGSDPGAPSKDVLNTSDMRKWNGALKDAVFGKLQLVVIRVQMYGRGTYPVITLAGWHGALDRNATPEDLKTLDEDLCRANDGAPLGIIAGIDRANILRIRCPGPPRWDRL
ncbi:MAG TPA: hypothetical protein VGL81_10270 [Polyangiaceae bacterium]|jgi:hypothetical protein